jgi:hypothetical protein
MGKQRALDDREQLSKDANRALDVLLASCAFSRCGFQAAHPNTAATM